MKKNILLFIVIVTLICGCATLDEDPLFKSSSQTTDLFADVPKSSKPEAQYGYSVYLHVISYNDLVVDESINNWIRTIGDSIIAFVERSYFPYTFTVINDARVYTTSTPGGFVYVSKGMIDFCQTDDRIAAVIAHELAQIQHRRMRFTLRKRMMNLAQSTSSYSSLAMGPAGVAIPKGMRFVNNVLLHEKSRLSRTIDADKLAYEYLHAAGYDPNVLEELIASIATIEGDRYSLFKDYTELRPITRERIVQLKDLKSELNE